MNFVDWKKLFFWAWASSCAFGQPPDHQKLSKPLLAFRNSLKEFEKGNCKDALVSLQSIQIPMDLENSEQISEALKMLAICHMQLGQKEEAQDALSDLLFLDPTYEFNPFDTPRPILELHQKLKDQIVQKKEEMASAKEKLITQNQKAQPEPSSASKDSPKIDLSLNWTRWAHSTWAYFLPFGGGHFLSGSKTKALIYGSSQASLLFLNLGAFWWKQSYLVSLGSNRLIDTKYQSTFQTAQTFQYVALAGLLLTYVVSVMDAIFENSGPR